MTLSIYDASIPVFIRQFENMIAILKKGAAHAEAKKIDPLVLTGARLAPDMFPLSRQVQIATDVAKGGAARLAGVEIPSFPDTETTFAELQARIEKTTAFLKTFTLEQLNGGEGRDIRLKAGPRELAFKGKAYLLDFVIPNVFFHATTTYAILRHNGVEIGKMDFLGEM